MNGMLIAGIVFLILLAVIVIVTPYYWCKVGGDASLATCCAPFFVVAIFLALGVSLVIFGNEKEQHHRLRH